MTTFVTTVMWLPALSPLPGRWSVSHKCRECLKAVKADDLIAHVLEHDPTRGSRQRPVPRSPSVPRRSRRPGDRHATGGGGLPM